MGQAAFDCRGVRTDCQGLGLHEAKAAVVNHIKELIFHPYNNTKLLASCTC
ncbi:uncharacterized protein METZ01_LOCUS459586 [marine metagenome]|uniref:Uncharacterized protein n=1 Tax=marine metagenome TaxID=408172 RepID=A0A383AG80_9ZZZZ